MKCYSLCIHIPCERGNQAIDIITYSNTYPLIVGQLGCKTGTG